MSIFELTLKTSYVASFLKKTPKPSQHELLGTSLSAGSGICMLYNVYDFKRDMEVFQDKRHDIYKIHKTNFSD
jgi:hypothetical protein